jgi:hypothetical protein
MFLLIFFGNCIFWALMIWSGVRSWSPVLYFGLFLPSNLFFLGVAIIRHSDEKLIISVFYCYSCVLTESGGELTLVDLHPVLGWILGFRAKHRLFIFESGGNCDRDKWPTTKEPHISRSYARVGVRTTTAEVRTIGGSVKSRHVALFVRR